MTLTAELNQKAQAILIRELGPVDYGTRPKKNAHLSEIPDEVPGLRKPAAAFRHAACCERGKPRFHRASSVPIPPGSQLGCIAQRLQQAVAVQGAPHTASSVYFWRSHYARFIQQYEEGTGNYTRDRHHWLGEESAEILHEEATQLATTGEFPSPSVAILLTPRN